MSKMAEQNLKDFANLPFSNRSIILSSRNSGLVIPIQSVFWTIIGLKRGLNSLKTSLIRILVVNLDLKFDFGPFDPD